MFFDIVNNFCSWDVEPILFYFILLLKLLSKAQSDYS